MIDSLTCAQVRRVDHDAVAELGLPSLLLMENAARAVCDAILRMNIAGRMTIVCGPGNNGGDGLAVARLSAAMGISSTVLLIRGGKLLSNDAAQNLQFLQNCGLEVSEFECSQVVRQLELLSSDDLIVDALLGTGIRGTVRAPFCEVINATNESNARVLSVDVPSGLDCDLGTPCGVSVRAERTVTFVAGKVGFLNPGSQGFTGEVEVGHIGIPQSWLKSWRQRISTVDCA